MTIRVRLHGGGPAPDRASQNRQCWACWNPIMANRAGISFVRTTAAVPKAACQMVPVAPLGLLGAQSWMKVVLFASMRVLAEVRTTIRCPERMPRLA